MDLGVRCFQVHPSSSLNCLSLTSVFFSFHYVFFFVFSTALNIHLHSIVVRYNARMLFQFLYFLSFALCVNMWLVLRKFPWAAEKNVYSLTFGWDVM